VGRHIVHITPSTQAENASP